MDQLDSHFVGQCRKCWMSPSTLSSITLMSKNTTFNVEQRTSLQDITLYQPIIRLLYLTNTRLNLSYAVQLHHHRVTHCILCYIKILLHGVYFFPTTQASNLRDLMIQIRSLILKIDVVKSNDLLLIFVCLFSKSKKQSIISQSSFKALLAIIQ